MERFQGIESEGFLDAPNVPVIALSRSLSQRKKHFPFVTRASLNLKGCPLPGTGAGKCHGTTSRKVTSSITVRDFSISSDFMLS